MLVYLAIAGKNRMFKAQATTDRSPPPKRHHDDPERAAKWVKTRAGTRPASKAGPDSTEWLRVYRGEDVNTEGSASPRVVAGRKSEEDLLERSRMSNGH